MPPFRFGGRSCRSAAAPVADIGRLCYPSARSHALPKKFALFLLSIWPLLLAKQADAQSGVGWSISAVASGWYLERISEAGDRVQLTCSFIGGAKPAYGLIVLPNKKTTSNSPMSTSLNIEQGQNRWIYPLARIEIGYWWRTYDRKDFAELLSHVNGLTLDDHITVEGLGIRFVPRNSDQETTIWEYRKLCLLP